MQNNAALQGSLRAALDAARPYPEAVYVGKYGAMAVLTGPRIGDMGRWNVRRYYRRIGATWRRIRPHSESTYHDTLDEALAMLRSMGFPLDTGWIAG